MTSCAVVFVIKEYKTIDIMTKMKIASKFELTQITVQSSLDWQKNCYNKNNDVIIELINGKMCYYYSSQIKTRQFWNLLGLGRAYL